jgi:hypothetical protein
VKRSRWGFILSTAAVIWSVGLIGLAYAAPVYSTTSSDFSCHSNGRCHGTLSHGGLTLVDVNGTGVLYLLGFLIALTVLCWVGLHFRRSSGSRLGTFLGWSAAGLMTLLAVTAFDLFAFVLPMALMMIAAAVKTPRPRPPAT